MITIALDRQQSPDRGQLTWRDAKQCHKHDLGDFTTIGRDAINHLCFTDTWISNRHARIEKTENGFLLRDLRSRNGTLVNGSRVLECLLRDGDHIQIGETDLIFVVPQAGREPIAPPQSKNIRWGDQLRRLPSVAETSFPVLLTGPSGAGKDVLARAIHQFSSRNRGPFVAVNCSALSESLVESELFGHVRGSFTGATSDRKGAFESARKGTLFLDEVGDLPLTLQPKLLRALENQHIRPVGSDSDVKTDIRIIAATHHDLSQLVLEGRFRADLFFRLNVVQLQAPALKDRMEDFEDIFYQLAKDIRVRFSYLAIERLKSYAWPGNIRELKNVIARAKAMFGSDEVRPQDLDLLLDLASGQSTAATEPRPSRSVIKEIEIEMIRSRLKANRGNQRQTAADLGMPKSTLHDRLKAYGLLEGDIKA